MQGSWLIKLPPKLCTTSLRDGRQEEGWPAWHPGRGWTRFGQNPDKATFVPLEIS